MCGIVGYVGEREVASLLLEGLHRLEYRGYDSAGLCVRGDSLAVHRSEGRIASLEGSCPPLPGSAGIAHTRWATHGAPVERNAHPHVSADGSVAVVHNGIIENHESLRAFLAERGYAMASETDSEVLAHLVEHFFAGDLSSAVREALDLVQGTFGLAVMHEGFEGVVVARRGSPLVLGVGEGEMFVASDVAPILGYTNRVVYLSDDELAVVRADGFSLSTLAGDRVHASVEEVSWELEQIEKGGFAHFMLKEIFEQPDSLRSRLAGRVRDGKLHLSVDIGTPARVVIVACGTSWHAGLIGKQLIERLVRVPVEVDYASEFRYRDPVVDSDTLVVAVSQSGETADTLEAVRAAKRKGARTLGLVNVVGSTIAREVDCGVYLHAGPEIGVASTKAFSAQVLSLSLLALFMRQELLGDLDEEFLEAVFAVPDVVERALGLSEEMASLADEFVEANNFLYLGRGFNYPVALEGALKLKEISYIHAEGYPAAEMKHGPIALIDERMPVFFIATRDQTYEKVLSNMQETKARGGRVVALVSELSADVQSLADYTVLVPRVREELSPIVNVVPLQLFSYYVAAKRGLDVDKPRNLAKSVTVE